MNQLKAIESKIFELRGQKVMLDRDLAQMHGVETRILNQAVKRNISRFPEDFMFQLNEEEFQNWKSQIVISNSIRMVLRRKPLAFTEQGVAELEQYMDEVIGDFNDINEDTRMQLEPINESLAELQTGNKKSENGIRRKIGFK